MAQPKFSFDKIDQRLAAIYRSDENKQEKYDRWAGQYENDLVDELDYVAHIDAANIFHSLGSGSDERILDVACGTGLVGVELHRLGYSRIDGTDFSAEMLSMAKRKAVYQSVFQHDFTQPLPLSERYDRIICVGLFAFSIPKITDMIHVIRAVKPQGLCVITVNGAAWQELDLGTLVQQEAAQYQFTIEQIIEAGYIRGQGIDARVLVIRASG